MAGPLEFLVGDISNCLSREVLPVRQSDAFRPLGPLTHVGLECLQTTTNLQAICGLWHLARAGRIRNVLGPGIIRECVTVSA